jgi:transposase
MRSDQQACRSYAPAGKNPVCPAHKTKKLNEWVSENSNRIEVFFLQPYSPELNPLEYVN